MSFEQNRFYKTIRNKKSFLYRSKNDYKTSRHLKVDKLAAKKKLQLLTTTDLFLNNSLEPFRVSNYNLFKLNLSKLSIWLTTSLIYLISLSISDSIISFTLLFAILLLLIHYHYEAYKSFVLIRKNVKYLSENVQNRSKLLNTYLGLNPKISDKDSFNWLNRIICFFWPYLSHLIHFELNEFFKREIESGSLANSVESSKRLLYALLRQFDTNILVVEKFQLGDKAPNINKISTNQNVFLKPINKDRIKKEADDTSKNNLSIAFKKVYRISELMNENSPNIDGKKVVALPIIKNEIGRKLREENKTLVFDLDLDYNGDMYVSVIYKYLCCCSSRLGLADIYLSFKLRIILSPIKDDVPFVEEISLTLLELPDFGYKGIALAELAELRIVRGVLNRLISENLLYPKCLTISIGNLLKNLINDPESFRKQSSTNTKSTSRHADENKHLSATRKDVSTLTKILARSLLCGCLITNSIFRCCQKHKQNTVQLNSKSSQT